MPGTEATGWSENPLCKNCNRFIKQGKTFVWVHLDNDTWCDPKQDPFSVTYKVATLKEEV